MQHCLQNQKDLDDMILGSITEERDFANIFQIRQSKFKRSLSNVPPKTAREK